ncbi:HTH domain-containing protein [Lacticaseibacillus casei]|uniref:Frv operon regulatory protein n=1 Tax=Lacticaseibacillus huelsenbergensis TaxID=3035291 RepID=A0ABY8DM01_9LACO|nr:MULTISPECIES: putative frv operon regulatory protein [Lacticaseibacillus]MDG3061253.1 putative frv operon regulatory protein [Lacticaseibacillus sp. BCRC 81376]QVI38718.1 HTH domain-containing protein [Lacticaseibacillus casei]QXG60445.1 HTH domain-containing protein [Lacticaseibacillus casei]WFB37999.1 putative frv operon regulatory protein [Lacticaseibacillus huelsenbergensis]WFB42403.1 putative frv operon regulatory protein [Lacticaseibacillus huelsenbergensis]
MLPLREVKILRLLSQQDFSGDELAKQLKASRRTIVRDIAAINDEIQKNRIGSITAQNKYHLTTLNPGKLTTLLNTSRDEANEILLRLCMQKTIAMGDLTSDMFLSRAQVTDYLTDLNSDYQDLLHISTRPGTGVTINMKRLTRIDLAADCLFEFPQLLAKVAPGIENTQRINTYLAQNACPYMTWVIDSQWRAQVISAFICRSSAKTYDSETAVTAGVNQFVQSREKLLAGLIAKHTSLMKSFSNMADKFQLEAIGQKTLESLFTHFGRECAFPRPLSTLSNYDITRLAAQNPVAFDFAQAVTDELLKADKQIWMDANFLALYIVQAINQREVKPVKILFLAPRMSLAQINATIIQQKLHNIVLDTVHSLTEAESAYAKGHFDLAIANVRNDVIEQSSIKFALTFSAVASEDDMTTLEQLVNGQYYHDNIAAMLAPNHFTNVAVTDKFLPALKKGLQIFSDAGLLAEEDLVKIVEREEAGNQLVLNHISIPHIVTASVSDYRLFAIKPEEKVTVENQEVYLMVIVLVGTSQAEKNTIFSYLYQTLRQYSTANIRQVQSYQQVIALLRGMGEFEG